MPPDLALSSTLIDSNYPCLELIFMVPKVFEPLKFDCMFDWLNDVNNTELNYLSRLRKFEVYVRKKNVSNVIEKIVKLKFFQQQLKFFSNIFFSSHLIPCLMTHFTT